MKKQKRKRKNMRGVGKKKQKKSMWGKATLLFLRVWKYEPTRVLKKINFFC
jgi:hypothetical protein